MASKKRRKVAPTQREHAVLRMLAEGSTQREAAEALGVALRTVNTYVYRVRDFYGIPTTVGAVVEAIRRGDLVLDTV